MMNQGQDYNLDSSYYIISAYRTNSKTLKSIPLYYYPIISHYVGQTVLTSLAKHSNTPSISPSRYNPMRDTYQEMPTSVCPNAPVSHSNSNSNSLCVGLYLTPFYLLFYYVFIILLFIYYFIIYLLFYYLFIILLFYYLFIILLFNYLFILLFIYLFLSLLIVVRCYLSIPCW